MSTTTPTPDSQPAPTPQTPSVTPGGKQQHGNPQIALCAGGNLISTPGAVMP